jgi:hypothetical protein
MTLSSLLRRALVPNLSPLTALSLRRMRTSGCTMCLGKQQRRLIDLQFLMP